MELRRYTALIWRWAWLIILGAAVTGSAVYLINSNSTPVYRATTRLLIDEAPGSVSGNEYSQLLLEQRLALTYLQILKTRPVFETTIERLNLPFSPGALSGMVTVSAPEDTQILVVSVEDTNAERAALIANTIGDVFIDQNQEREALRYAEPIANWQQRQKEIANEIESLESELNALGDSETAADATPSSRLRTELNEAQIRYTEAFNNLNDLQISLAKESSNVIQIEPAQPSTVPVRPRTTFNTVLALFAGGLAALGVVFLIEYLDDTIKTPDQVAEATGLSTLGAIAIIEGSTWPERLITARAPRAPISEAYRVLRTNLSFSAVDGDLRSLLITSSSPGEGKSTTAANLAVVVSQTGKRVTLVDSDLRRPILHKFFELNNNQGLTTAVLDSETPTSYHLQRTKIPGLQVMTSGPIPPNPAELLSSQRMAHVLDTLMADSDLVILDTPPTLTVADASILAPQIDGCLVIVEMSRTRRDTLVQAVDRLKKANATLCGVLINLLQPSRSGYYYYDYYYRDYYNRGSRENRRRRVGTPRLPAWLSGLGRR